MKNNERIKLVWTREGCIQFIWNADEKLNCVNNLHDGGKFQNYSATRVLNCFSESVFSGNQVDPEAHGRFSATKENHSNSVINMLTNVSSLEKYHEDLEP